jgi:hypothetical protein
MRAHARKFYKYYVEQSEKEYKAMIYSYDALENTLESVSNMLFITAAKDNYALKERLGFVYEYMQNASIGSTYEAMLTKIKDEAQRYGVTITIDEEALLLSFAITYTKKYKKFKELEYKLENQSMDIVDYRTFNNIINMYNTNISEILIQGYKKFKIPFNLGDIKIMVLDTTDMKRCYDFPNSMKRKQAIIDKGGTPYNKKTAPDGEKWLSVYETTKEIFWKWSNHRYAKNSQYYRFYPSSYYPTEEGKYITSIEDITKNYTIDDLTNLSMGNVQRALLLTNMNPDHINKYNPHYDL